MDEFVSSDQGRSGHEEEKKKKKNRKGMMGSSVRNSKNNLADEQKLGKCCSLLHKWLDYETVP